MAKKLSITWSMMLALRMADLVAQRVYGPTARVAQADILGVPSWALEGPSRRVDIRAVVWTPQGATFEHLFKCWVNMNNGDMPPSPESASIMIEGEEDRYGFMSSSPWLNSIHIQ